jgi:cell division GTPase FtsZ
MPKIIAVGCGIEGNYAISQLFKLGVAHLKTIAIDTEKSRLDTVHANCKILIDEHSIQKLEKELKGVELLFIISSMGNKICTEATSILAEICRKQDSIVIGLVTISSENYSENQKPKMEDIIELSKQADTLAFVDNDRVLKLYPALPIDQICSFSGKLIADMVGVIVDSLNPEIPSLIRLDFDDLKIILKNGGLGTLVFNEVEEERDMDYMAKRLAQNIMLAHNIMQFSLMDVDVNTSKNCLLIFRHGVDTDIFEIEQIVSCATYDVDCRANVLWGSVETKDYYGKLRCMGIISGFNVSL